MIKVIFRLKDCDGKMLRRVSDIYVLENETIGGLLKSAKTLVDVYTDIGAVSCDVLIRWSQNGIQK